MNRHLRTFATAAVLLAGLSACQSGSLFSRSAKATPVAPQLSPVGPYAVEDRLYNHAVKAIEDRDYGLALDILQMAKESRPDDPRVLTAMGVVYDKLGRFDLSARYYTLAEQVDPGSKVVALDRAYSEQIQHATVQDRGGVTVMSRLEPSGSALSLAGPPATTTQRLAQITKIIRAGVGISNATGRPQGANLVRFRLAKVGWSVAPPRANAKRLAMSTVYYPPVTVRLAKALARSMPYPVKLKACPDCSQLRLYVGVDALPRAVDARASETHRG